MSFSSLVSFDLSKQTQINQQVAIRVDSFVVLAIFDTQCHVPNQHMTDTKGEFNLTTASLGRLIKTNFHQALNQESSNANKYMIINFHTFKRKICFSLIKLSFLHKFVSICFHSHLSTSQNKNTKNKNVRYVCTSYHI